MNAKQLLALQFTGLITMLVTAESLFENKTATAIFATAFFVFARCSIYISKHSTRLLRELNKKDKTYKVKV